MRSAKTVLAVLGAATVLVLAGNTVALATTGHSLLAGKVNSSSKVTTIKRTTAGAGLAVHTRSSGAAPFAVNGHGRVTNLNADAVDGLSSGALRTHSYSFTAEPVTNARFVSYRLNVPNGSYLVSYSAWMRNLTNDALVQCYVFEDHGKTDDGLLTGFSSFTVAKGASPGLTGSGLVTKTAQHSIVVQCGTGSNNQTWSTVSYAPIQIVATPTVDTDHGITSELAN